MAGPPARRLGWARVDRQGAADLEVMVSRLAWWMMAVGCAASGPGGDKGRLDSATPPVGSTPTAPSTILDIVGRVKFVADLEAMPQDALADDADVFDLVTADIDRDGDLDVVINHHLRMPIDVLRNDGGAFTLISHPDDDRGGVWDNPRIPDLYATEDEVLSSAYAPGLYVWHDPDRDDGWQFSWTGGRLGVRIVVNRPFVSVTGLPDGALRVFEDFEAVVALDDPSPVRWSTVNQLVGTQLRLELDDPTTPVFVGSDRVPHEGPVVSLWKPDPHGMAIADITGSPDPELFVTRGGLTGLLLPPHDPKTDQLFVAVDEEVWFRQDAAAIPANYGRGRQVAWVDVDGDGRNELYVANTETPNSLLDDDGTGVFRDRAAELGLDAVGGDSFAWLDLDGDGDEDLVQVIDDDLQLGWNDGSGRITAAPGSDLGLELPEFELAEGIFDRIAIQVLDYDADGDFDLWLSGIGPDNQPFVFRRDGGVFVDQTAELGLPSEGMPRLVPVDIDADRYVDMVAVTSEVHWWRNERGTGFADIRLDVDWVDQPTGRGCAADLDGDRWMDLVFATVDSRFVAWNRTLAESPAVRVDVEGAPVGAVVTGHYADGASVVQRVGSVGVTRYSQALRPMLFGGRPDAPLERVSVRWPDGREEEQVVSGTALTFR
ncbi:MAG: hypothetical protein ACI8PZ_001350 [Myxococcota bacterium]